MNKIKLFKSKEIRSHWDSENELLAVKIQKNG